MVKKLVCSLLIAASVIAVTPIGASAEWKNDSNGWWYEDGSSYYTGWKQISNKWYNFGSDGYMRKGWIQDGESWYYLQDDGSMVTGNITVSGKTYEFDNDGKWINNPGPSKEKLSAAPNFSWFTDNGKTYFKTKDNTYLKGTWNIDGDVYLFDHSGVMQTGKYTLNDKEELFGNDGKFVTCITDSKSKLFAESAITTKSTSSNSVVKLDDSKMMNIRGIYLSGETKMDANTAGVKVQGNTIYCKVNETIILGPIKVNGTDAQDSLFPSLIIRTDRTNKAVAFSTMDLNKENDFVRYVNPVIFTHEPGNTTVTVDVNGTKTSFNLVVTQ